MGVGVPWVLLPITFTIDTGTLIYHGIKNKSKKFSGKRYADPYQHNVSVIVPAYNEEDSIEATIRSVYSQTLKPKNVVVVDDCSTDKTSEICQNLQKEFGESFIYLKREKNSGKASNINYAVKELEKTLGDITLVVDSDVVLDEKCSENLIRNFTSDNVAAITPYGYTTPPKNLPARILHYGNAWTNRINRFRKRAQGYRNAISVICGACNAYRTEILKKIPIPTRTKTEDTDYTWLLQENGYKILYDNDAIIHSNDLEKPSSSIRQLFRWQSGTFQNIYVHGRKLPKAKSMFGTTIVPSLIESVPYAAGIVTLPAIAALSLVMPGSSVSTFSMDYVKGFLLTDFLFTAIPTAVISPKYLLHLPEIYIYKFLGSTLTLTALFKTSFERLMGKQYKWSNTWTRNYGNNPIKKDEKLSELEKKFFDLIPKTKVTDLATLEKELSEPIRFTELETKQNAENIIKEFVKNVNKKNFDHYRPKIIGMLKTYKEMFGEDGLEISLKTLFEKGTLDVYKPTYHHWKKSTEKRNRIIELVGRGYTTMSQISHETGFSYSSVYYHTKVLEKSNHLKRNKIGRKIEVRPKLSLGKKVKTYLGLDNQNPFKIKPEIDGGIKTLPPEKIVNILQSITIDKNK